MPGLRQADKHFLSTYALVRYHNPSHHNAPPSRLLVISTLKTPQSILAISHGAPKSQSLQSVMIHPSSPSLLHPRTSSVDIPFLSSHIHTNPPPKNTKMKYAVNTVSQEFSSVQKKGQTRPAAHTLSHPVPPSCIKAKTDKTTQTPLLSFRTLSFLDLQTDLSMYGGGKCN
jgi:hypothetical protein